MSYEDQPTTPIDAAENLVHVAKQLQALTVEIGDTPEHMNVAPEQRPVLIQALLILADASKRLGAECADLANAATQQLPPDGDNQ